MVFLTKYVVLTLAKMLIKMTVSSQDTIEWSSIQLARMYVKSLTHPNSPTEPNHPEEIKYSVKSASNIVLFHFRGAFISGSNTQRDYRLHEPFVVCLWRHIPSPSERRHNRKDRQGGGKASLVGQYYCYDIIGRSLPSLASMIWIVWCRSFPLTVLYCGWEFRALCSITLGWWLLYWMGIMIIWFRWFRDKSRVPNIPTVYHWTTGWLNYSGPLDQWLAWPLDHWTGGRGMAKSKNF